MTNRRDERTEADSQFAQEPVRRGPNWGLIMLIASLLIVAAFVISLVIGGRGPFQTNVDDASFAPPVTVTSTT